MRIISIKFNNNLAHLIAQIAQKNNVTISELIRDLLYEKMRQGPIVVDKTQKFKDSNFTPPNRKDIAYIIFTAKLLEKFIVATEEQGEILKDLAWAETEHLLTQLHLDGKGQRFSIRLEEQLFIWLNNEAARLQFKLIPLIRKLIAMTFNQNNLMIEPEISAIQKTAMQYQIIGAKLLEKLVDETLEGAAEFIKEVHDSTENILLQLDNPHLLSLQV